MAGAWEMFSRVYLEGLSRENSLLIETQTKAAHGRLINEFGTTGLLAMLVKTITMGFVALLGSFRLYFELEEDGSSTASPDNGINTDPKYYPQVSFFSSGSAPHAESGELSGIKPVKWQYYVYASLLMLSTLLIFIAMMCSVGNYLALSLIDDRGLQRYLKKVGSVADLPFLSLIWGVTVWHIALIVLMFYIVNTTFGIIFMIGCLFSIWLITYGMSSMLLAVDGALLASKQELLKNPKGAAAQYSGTDEDNLAGTQSLLGFGC